MFCPNDGSKLEVQVINTVDLKVKGKGVIWWLLIGWWWVPFKWICFFWLALIVKLIKGKKYQAINKTKKMAVCHTCGFSKEIK